MNYSSSRKLPVVTADGEGIASLVGGQPLREIADRTGLTDGFCGALGATRQRRSKHNPGLVLRDTAVMLAGGGDCMTDLETMRGQRALFGPMASNVTAWRVLRQKAPRCLGELRTARARARAHAWKVGGGPEGSLTVDFDSTLVTAHSDKEEARGSYKGGYGFHPLMCFVDRGSECGVEPLAGILRPGNASPDNAADHLELLGHALAQIPEHWLSGDEPKLARSDSAGSSHDFVDAVHNAGFQFSIGLPIREGVRESIIGMPESGWIPALTQQGTVREGAEVCELDLNLAAWPEGTRAICRRERAHPGAQLRLWEDQGIRHQVFLTDQSDSDIATLEVCHRCRAR